MKKIYNAPEVKITAFELENVVTGSGGGEFVPDENKTTRENVNAYIRHYGLGAATDITLTW